MIVEEIVQSNSTSQRCAGPWKNGTGTEVHNMDRYTLTSVFDRRQIDQILIDRFDTAHIPVFRSRKPAFTIVFHISTRDVTRTECQERVRRPVHRPMITVVSFH